MANPPTTLNAARAMASSPSTFWQAVVSTANRRMPPSIVTAETALVIDISGVCRSGGTREMSR